MAIAFARPEYVSRSSGKNACLKGAYNARTTIKDIQTCVIYNFQNRTDNVYHEILLPQYVDSKFKDVSLFTNEIERSENRKDSQLCVEWVIALPKEEEITLDMKKEIINEFIDRKGWIKEGLGVQIDIHKPHAGEINWHAHLLVTTRRFRKDGLGFESKKARDLQPKVLNGYVQKSIEIDNHNFYRRVLEDKFKERGLDLRVDLPGEITQEHIGPVRMRSVLNQAAERNEERRLTEIEHLYCGDRVLDKVIRHMSIFTRGDLVRAVKYVSDLETREKLVEDALANKSIIALHREDGTATQYFTTQEVRIEEQKILRLSNYVANGSNVFTTNQDIANVTSELILAVGSKLTEEQHNALTSLLTSKSALQILRGRAGSGKSHVLRQIAAIALDSNIHVIGLAPTHKAKEALSADGFSHTDTVKGMLFKLHNARFDLPKNSLLVVDEAGMIGNDDYQELLRVAATRKCTVILSGDERQLSSVQRGGMFEVLANKYGSSTILNIKRQDCEWGKNVAMALSKGDVRTGVAILEQENRIKWQSDSLQSMQSLLKDWHESDYSIDDKIILAVKNKDVAALNHGVRQYLKCDGKLTGQEIHVSGNHYMTGDRIVISSTDKDLGVINGDVGVILEASLNRFIISLNNTNYIKNSKDSKTSNEHRLVEFNPSEFNSFKHGYATSVFKAQGASIKDVYVYHDGFAGLRNSYVALSRNISRLNLYVNKAATSCQDSLIRQLSEILDNGSSLNYLTKDEATNRLEDIETLNNMNALSKSLVGIYDFAARGITKLSDKYLPKSEYYHYQEPSQRVETAEEVLDRVYEDLEQIRNQHVNIDTAAEIGEEKLVVGGNSTSKTNHKLEEIAHATTLSDDVRSSAASAEINSATMVSSNKPQATTRAKLSAKARFYANVDYSRRQEQRSEENRERYRSEVDNLRRELSIKAESVVVDLLGKPNSKLSKGSTLKYGNNGSLAVKISGSKAGTWYDFSEGKGGDLFDLVSREKYCDFKESVNYLQDRLGISSNISKPNLQVVNDHAIREKYVDHYKQIAQEKLESLSKIRKAKNLYDKSIAIGQNSTAARYLVQTRNINIDFAQEGLSNDIRAVTLYEKSLKQKVPVLVAFARDASGNITGGQQILLNSKTINKADIDIPKRSFGKIAGSFVDVGRIGIITDLGNRSITIIAEGLETALSVKQALSYNLINEDKQVKILCSLGISNIKNYQPVSGEKIIIAADNDGKGAVTNITVDTVKSELTSKGAFVEIVRPSILGDFNDILKDKPLGEQEIQNSFNRALTKHSAVTLEQYFGSSDGVDKLSKQEQANITYIQQFKINEEKIIDAYRISPLKGSAELDVTKKAIEFADNFTCEHKHLVNEMNAYGAKIERRELVVSLVGKNYDEMEQHLTLMRDKYYIIDHLEELAKSKQEAKTPQQTLRALANEQQYLASLNNDINRYKFNEQDHSQDLLARVNKAHELHLTNEIDNLYKTANYAHKEKILSADELTNHFKSDHRLDIIHNNINSVCHQYHCNLLRDHCNKIASGQSIMHQGQEFDCVVKYLEHWKDHVDHRMLPIKDIDRIIERELDRQIEHDHHHNLDL